MPVSFSKYHGLGNDFIVVDGELPEWARALAPRICDRHEGVGADGILISGEQGGQPTMWVINADGSEPEMCGNGIRCMALHRLRAAGAEVLELQIRTAAGPRLCRALGGALAAQVEVAMGPVSFAPEAVPVRSAEPLVEAPFAIGGTHIRLTALSMGNPHAVTFDDVEPGRREELGELLAHDARFPAGTNAGFARMDGERITLFVRERGVGWTRACGTGACAAAAAAVENGRVPRGTPVEVRLPGGSLEITVGAPGEPVRMTGPAVHVYDGVLSPEAFRAGGPSE